MPIRATTEERNRAADLLHGRIVAKQESRWLRDPADIVHVNALSRQLTREGVAFVADAPEELFHYTRLENFVKIVDSGVLHATDAEQCNDSKEVVHGRELIAECLQSQISRAMPRSPRREFFEYFAKELVRRVRPKYYVVCFSSRERGRLEWGEYADGGRGVVVAMNLVESTPDAKIISSDEVVTLRPITYGRAEQETQLRHACELAYEAVARRLGPSKSFVRNLPFVATVGAVLCSHLTCQAAAFKDPFWEDEHEWRITASLYGEASDAEAIQRSPSGRHYVRVSYPESRLPITRVVVGPLASDEDELLVRNTLSAKGYDVPLSRSDVPLR